MGNPTTFHLPDEPPKKAKPRKLKEREATIEAYLRDRVKANGGIAYKFTSPARRSVPDRLVLLDVAKAGRALRELMTSQGAPCPGWDEATFESKAAAIVAEMAHLVELKATGEKPTELQLREHARLRALGFTVLVIDSKAEVDARYPKP